MRQMKRLMPVAVVVFVLMAGLSACDRTGTSRLGR
jgi:hypothetical protein